MGLLTCFSCVVTCWFFVDIVISMSSLTHSFIHSFIHSLFLFRFIIFVSFHYFCFVSLNWRGVIITLAMCECVSRLCPCFLTMPLFLNDCIGVVFCVGLLMSRVN